LKLIQIYTSSKLAGISLIVVPPIVLFAVLYGRYVRKITREVQDKLAESSHLAEEKFSNIRTVRSFAQEATEIGNYNNAVKDIYELSRKVIIARSMFFGYVSEKPSFISYFSSFFVICGFCRLYMLL